MGLIHQESERTIQYGTSASPARAARSVSRIARRRRTRIRRNAGLERRCSTSASAASSFRRAWVSAAARSPARSATAPVVSWRTERSGGDLGRRRTTRIGWTLECLSFISPAPWEGVAIQLEKPWNCRRRQRWTGRPRHKRAERNNDGRAAPSIATARSERRVRGLRIGKRTTGRGTGCTPPMNWTPRGSAVHVFSDGNRTTSVHGPPRWKPSFPGSGR